RRLLGPLIAERDFSVTAGGDQVNPLGAWVRLESEEFAVKIIRDRGQEWINVGTKVRPKPRAPLRCPPLGHLLAYLDGDDDPCSISTLEAEAEVLTRRADEVFDSTLINSEDYRRWAV